MSLLTLIANLLLAVLKLFGQQQEHDTGAALQRDKENADEQARLSAADRAGDAAARSLPDPADPLDRDGGA